MIYFQLGLTCLTKACAEGREGIVKILLNSGADANLPDEVYIHYSTKITVVRVCVCMYEW